MKPLKFTILLLFVILLAGIAVQAQVNNRQKQLQDQIYSSFVKGDVRMWERTITEFERLYNSRQEPSILYDLLLARYGFIAMSVEKNPSQAREQLHKAEAELEKLFTYSSYQSNAYAMQGAFLGFRISLRPLSAVVLGPRSYSAINKSVEADTSNPVAWMEMGNSRFYTPSAFGGSKQQALEHYQKSVDLFEKNMPNNQRWLYLNSLVGLAKSYQYTNQKRKAEEIYRKALAFEPRFKWVKELMEKEE
jgi:tetratricopeptide (TPR) repeat protein